MKQLLKIFAVAIVLSFTACAENLDLSAPDKLTASEEMTINAFVGGEEYPAINVDHLERFITEPDTRGWPSCWGRRSAKIMQFMIETGLTREDIIMYIEKHKPIE